MTPTSDALDALIAAAERAMTVATGGQAACVLTRAGIPAPAAKYAEGRWAALRALRTRLRTSPYPAAVLASLRLQWREDLDARMAASAGPDWIAYLTGGLDALTEAADYVTGGQGSRTADQP